MRFVSTILPACLLLVLSAAPCAEAATLRAVCGPRTGLGGAPAAPTAWTARTIFMAAERAQGPRQRQPRGSKVEVVDAGGFWSVFRWVPPVMTRKGLIAREGGGELQLVIDKCTGAISQLALAR